MNYDPLIHHRHSIRIKNFDYSGPGAYFFTVVTMNRVVLFGEVIHGEMHLNEIGRIILSAWMDLPNHYLFLELGAFLVMPNHVHAVVILTEDARVGTGLRPAPTVNRHGLPEIVRAFKSFSARRVNEYLGTPGHAVWQRNYYEGIIRDQEERDRINR